VSEKNQGLNSDDYRSSASEAVEIADMDVGSSAFAAGGADQIQWPVPR